MLKKILDFFRKIGLLHGGASTWKGKGTGDYMTADLDKHKKKEDKKEHEKKDEEKKDEDKKSSW